MHARHMSPNFPVQRTRVLSGAGDEESFETKDSPPAVAGPLLAPRAAGARGAAPLAALPKQPGSGSQDLLLDLVTGTESLTESLQRLVNASAQSVIRTAGLRIECGVVVHQP